MKKWLIFGIIALLQNAQAQDALQNMLGNSLRERMQKTTSPVLAPAVALEKEIDAAEYYVGPGDQFLILVGGTGNDNLEAVVSPEGDLILPAIGAIPVANRSLRDAKSAILERLATKYTSRGITVHLTMPRSFKVSVAGAVQNPGLVEVTGASRAAEAIDLAGGLIQPLKVQSKTEQVMIQTPATQESSVRTSRMNPVIQIEYTAGSKRNISIRRRNGELVHVDLQKYTLTGDLGVNPCLRDGDVIIVPNEESTAGRISIFGALKSPDAFEFAPGDRVCDLIDMAHGFTTDADSSAIELVRFRGAGSSTFKEVLSLPPDDPAARAQTLNYPLQPDDRLYVRFQPKFHETRNVEVTGEVYYPGIYAISDGETHLTDLIQRAGGLTKEASLKNAFIQRRAQEDLADPEFERLKKMTVAEMTENEKTYFKIKSRERVGGMGVDFSALFERGDKSQDVLLRDRDLINIPAKEQTVKVSGQVVNPGLYPYQPGKTLKHYLNEAGGFNWNARKSRVRIIRSQTGEWTKPKDDTIVEIGDTVFVPEKPERDYWEQARSLITVIAQMAMIYSVIYNAQRN
ncbi:MAG TPA: SLBB domain-containing protein [bacterium]|nr:SLBB domain-containing protein [bacterium]HQI49000.1 SLBB domain-containing protein [bacterium]HQJ65083.1 SLBB domain-containing protein [bacterium]